MIPDPGPIHPLVARSGLIPRLVMQIAASAFFTIFYTPGGVAGWTLDLALRGFEIVRPFFLPCFSAVRARRFALVARLAPIVADPSKTGRRSSVT
jgi:hypothetical protein